MKMSTLLAGNAPHFKKYQVAATNTVIGVPYLEEVLADGAGVVLASTTGAANALGISTDAPGTYLTAQQSDNSDPARVVTLIVNPGAVFRARLSGGAASGTALSPFTNTVASSDGLLTTLGLAAGYDDGVIWGYDGGNTGILRKVTAVAGTNETIIQAFPFDIAVGDRFLAATFGAGQGSGCTLTTTLDEVNATSDGQANANFRCLDFFQKDAAERGNLDSYVELVLHDHLYAGNIT